MYLIKDKVMLLYFKVKCFLLLIFSWCDLPSVQGETLCNNELLKSINVSTALKSDVLLPCYFDPALFGSDKSADIAVVWSQMNILYLNLVEITVQGESRFWNNKGGRIETFPGQAGSGNFSILTRKVNELDLDLYKCSLHKGFNCTIAYQELHLGLTADQMDIIPGVIGGAALLILLVSSLCYVFFKRRQQKRPEINYGNTMTNLEYDRVTVPESNDTDAFMCENPIYTTAVNLKRDRTEQ